MKSILPFLGAWIFLWGRPNSVVRGNAAVVHLLTLGHSMQFKDLVRTAHAEAVRLVSQNSGFEAGQPSQDGKPDIGTGLSSLGISLEYADKHDVVTLVLLLSSLPEHLPTDSEGAITWYNLLQRWVPGHVTSLNPADKQTIMSYLERGISSLSVASGRREVRHW